MNYENVYHPQLNIITDYDAFQFFFQISIEFHCIVIPLFYFPPISRPSPFSVPL